MDYYEFLDEFNFIHHEDDFTRDKRQIEVEFEVGHLISVGPSFHMSFK